MGGTCTELEAIAIAGTSGNHRSRLYQKTYKVDTGTALESDTLAGTSGYSRSRLYQKQVKGGGAMVPKSRQTHWPVLAGILPPALSKINKGDTGTELEANALSCTSGALYPDFTKNTDKGDTGTEFDANALSGASGIFRSRLYQENQ